jgi:hypothetical protein
LIFVGFLSGANDIVRELGAAGSFFFLQKVLDFQNFSHVKISIEKMPFKNP